MTASEPSPTPHHRPTAGSRLASLLQRAHVASNGANVRKALPFRAGSHYNARSFRADSSAGRALRSQCRGREFDPPSVHQEFLAKTAHYTLQCDALFCFVWQVFAESVWQSCAGSCHCQVHSKAVPLSCGLRRSGLPSLPAVGLSSAACLTTSFRSRWPNAASDRFPDGADTANPPAKVLDLRS